jgi:hypothetical protein
VLHQTQLRANSQELLQRNISNDDHCPTETHYQTVYSDEIRMWVPNDDHKAFQLLHHMFCYESSQGLQLVGNDKKLMCGLVVKYSEDL